MTINCNQKKGSLADDFIIVESGGEKVRNKDLDPRLREYIEKQLLKIEKLQIDAAIKLLRKKTNGKSNKGNTIFYLDRQIVIIDIQSNDPKIGESDAKITIVEFTDYECPYCTRGNKVIKQVLAAYPNSVKLVVKDFPLGFHKNAIPAAEAAHCVNDQDGDKYWQFRDLLFGNRKNLAANNLQDYAAQVGVDLNEFNLCVANKKFADKVKDGQKRGMRAGVSGTPAFFINGILLSGAQPFNKFKEIIEEELNSGS